MRRHMAAAVVGLLACSMVCWEAKAQPAGTWPTRPIRLIITSAAGTGSDILARAFAERMSVGLKQPIVVDNRPGANGMVATRAVMAAPTDGYTLLYSNASSTVMLAALDPKLGVDFMKDLKPVGVTVVGGVLLLVNPQVPATSLGELISLVKAAPDKHGYASWGVGSNGHLTMEWLKSKTGMQTAHIPYKSMPTLLTELVAGLVQIGWADPVSPLPFVKSGKLRAIAVNGTSRTPQLPQLPTMGEQGYPFPAVGWQGVFAPAGTPGAIVDRVHAEINRVQANPELRALIVRNNIEAPPIWSTTKFHELIASDVQVWRDIVRDGNIKME